MNNITMLARLTQAPEVNQLPNGDEVLNIRLAADSKRYDKNTKRYKPFFVDASMYGERGVKLVPYLQKGKQIYVSGSMVTEVWEAKDGSKRFKPVFDIDNLRFVSGSQDEPKQDAGVQALKDNFQATSATKEYDDVPF